MRALVAVALVLSTSTVAFTGASAGEWKRVGKAERDLLIVADLSAHGNQSYTWLYRFLEGNAVSSAVSKLGDSYRQVYALSKENATLARFADGLTSMAANEQVRAIDVFVNLHGTRDRLTFNEGSYAASDIRATLASRDPEQASKLRVLYSTACYGESHAPEFLNAGFLAASGSRAVNSNGAYDYPTTMKAWRDGRTLAQATEKGNNAFWRNFYDGAARTAGFDDVDSFKTVQGATDVTIDWMWENAP